MLNKLTGRYKRPNRPGSEIAVVEHAALKITDNRGVEVPYIFGVRVDAAAPGLVVLLRRNAFLGDIVTEQVTEKAMPLDGWYITPFQEQGDSWAYIERIEPDDMPYKAENAKPVSDFLADKPKAKKVKPQTAPAPAPAA